MTNFSTPSESIDIIIPFRNRSWCLRRALMSVLSQTYRNWHLFLVDDGSTDDSLDSISDLSWNPRITVISQSPQGVSAARNYGVRQGSASLICFLDSDDEWHPRKLEKQYRHFVSNKLQISQCQEIWIRNGKRVNPPKRLEKKEGDLFSASLQDCMITPSSVMMQRKLYEKFGGFSEKLPACEDYDLWLKITANTPVGLLDELLMTRYGGHEDQLSTKYQAMDQFRILSLSRLIQESKIPSQTPLTPLTPPTPLSAEQRCAAEKVLEKKLRILWKGAVKHQNDKLQSLCRQTAALHTLEL
jgi:glycosyltransferase involved in cell wall biosynthesis